MFADTPKCLGYHELWVILKLVLIVMDCHICVLEVGQGFACNLCMRVLECRHLW